MQSRGFACTPMQLPNGPLHLKPMPAIIARIHPSQQQCKKEILRKRAWALSITARQSTASTGFRNESLSTPL